MTSASSPFSQLCSPWINDLAPYQPGRDLQEVMATYHLDDVIKLASNENPLGCGKRARQAMLEALNDASLYPDGAGLHLRQVLADFHHLSLEQITLGNGSNDVLELVASAFLRPNVESVFSQYAFSVYFLASQARGADLKIAPARSEDLGHDLDAMRALVTERTRVVWVANPNNPIGTWLNAHELRAFAESLPATCILVIDEAYAEYVEEADYPDTTTWVKDFPNLLVTRTFSKAHGLAALRAGYGVSSPALAELLNRVRQPFNMNSIAQAAAAAAIHDQEHVKRSVEVNRQGLAQLSDALTHMGLKWIPSVGNFLTIDLAQPAVLINEGLLRRGIIVRPLAGYGLPQHLRVTVGMHQQNALFLQALADVLAHTKVAL